MTVMPVVPDLLIWAREYRGLSPHEAAHLLRIPLETLSGIESGNPVNLTLFRRVSSKYRIPAATLLRRTRPPVPELPQDFRTLDGQAAVIGIETRFAIDYARTIAQNVLDLAESGVGLPTPILPRIGITEAPDEAGERERERLGIPVVNQFAWSAQEAFGIWRAFIERAGPYVLLQKFPLSQCKGFSLFDDINTPMIVISKEEQHDPPKIFTLIHEYCHLLLRRPGISDLDIRNPVEAYCNRFAAAFLIPRSALRALLPYWPDGPVEWDREQIRQWSSRLKVSQQALALRLEELRIAPVGFYSEFVSGQTRYAKKPKDDEESSGNYVNTQIFEMGNRYLSTVFRAADAGVVRPAEATEMTHLSPKHFERVRSRISQRFERANTLTVVLPH